MDSVCRTCLCIIRNGRVLNPVHQMKPDSDVNDRHKLEACVPELSVDIVVDPVICDTCKDSLEQAFQFKMMCLESEKTLYGHIQQRRQNEECTNLLSVYDMLALVRNDIILEHSYSSVAKPQPVETTTSSSPPPQEERTVNEPVQQFKDEAKRVLRPRKGQADLNGNEVRRTIVRRRKCKLCNKQLSSRSAFQRHMRTHSDKKRSSTNSFTCSICKLSFKQKTRLMAHVLLHRRTRCKSCKKIFNDFFSYKRHLRKCVYKKEIDNDLVEINKGGRSTGRRRSKRLKYFCKTCKRGFTTSFSRNRHTKNQHLDK